MLFQKYFLVVCYFLRLRVNTSGSIFDGMNGAAVTLDRLGTAAARWHGVRACALLARESTTADTHTVNGVSQSRVRSVRVACRSWVDATIPSCYLFRVCCFCGGVVCVLLLLFSPMGECMTWLEWLLSFNDHWLHTIGWKDFLSMNRKVSIGKSRLYTERKICWLSCRIILTDNHRYR